MFINSTSCKRDNALFVFHILHHLNIYFPVSFLKLSFKHVMFVSIQKRSAYSLTGCLKNLQLDGQWLSSMAGNFGVTPCYEGLSEAGTYFSEEGGYVVLGTILLVFFMKKKRDRLVLHQHLTKTMELYNCMKEKCSFCAVSLPKCDTMCICYITWLMRFPFGNLTSHSGLLPFCEHGEGLIGRVETPRNFGTQLQLLREMSYFICAHTEEKNG